MSKQRLALVSVLGAALVATPVLAVTVTTNLSVTANVPGGCSLSTNPVAFGDYSGTQIDVAGQLNANCTSALAYSVELGPGLSATGASRQMSNAGNNALKLNYELYKDAARSQAWGGTAYTVGTAQALSGQIGTGANQVIQIYGRLPAGQALSAGSFADTVVVSVIY
jgi:spore coat protein U domain-containing protein, fimbrial subunit CupE1/2/3/6